MAQLLLGSFADAAHHADGQRIEKLPLGSGVHHRQPARLVHVGGDLRHRLRRAHAHRARDAKGLDALLDAQGNQNRVLAIHARGRDVQKRLVDADLLHVRGLVAQDSHNLVADFLVPVIAPRGPNGMRAQLARLRSGHGGVHTKLTRLVRRRRHHAVLFSVAAHDDGLTAPSRVVKLFDRSKERVKVHQQNCRTVPRRQGAVDMFATFVVHTQKSSMRGKTLQREPVLGARRIPRSLHACDSMVLRLK